MFYKTNLKVFYWKIFLIEYIKKYTLSKIYKLIQIC